MKTPMNVFNTVMKKKKKNRKGFSLVELIVVLVIMAILSAALIPSLIGYISKTKEQNVQSECQQAVTAAQTIASGLYASADGKYTFTPAGGSAVTVDDSSTKNIVTTMGSAQSAVKQLAEVPGTIVTIVVSSDGLVTKLVYAEGDGSSGKKNCTYTRADATAAGTYTNGKVA